MQRAIWQVAFGLFAAVCAGFWVHSAWQDHEGTVRDVEQQTATTVRLLQEHADRAFYSGDQLLQSMLLLVRGRDLSDPAVSQRAGQRLRTLVEAAAPIGFAWYVDARGQRVLDASGQSTPYDLSAEPYFETHAGGAAGLLITGSVQVPGSEQTMFTLSRPLLDPEGRLEGVAVVGVESNHFESYYEEVGIDRGTTIQLFTNDGAVLVAWPATEPQAITPMLATLESSPGAKLVTAEDAEYAVVGRSLFGFPVRVVAAKPLEPALAAWRDRTLRSGLVLAAALLGFGLLMGMGLRSARRERFALAELKKANETLEVRVQERTADLARREHEVRLIADAVPALIAYIDADRRYRVVNRGYEQWFGLGQEEIIGKTVEEFLGEPAYSVVRPHLETALRGTPAAYAGLLQYRTTTPRHVQTHYLPDLAPDGTVRGVYAFITDVTQHKESEAALRDSEARYRALAEAIATVIWRTGPDGEVFEMAGWEGLTGQTAEQYRGSGWMQAVHPEDREAAAAVWTKSLGTGVLYDTEYRLRAQGGEYRWYHARGVPIIAADGSIDEWIGVCIDIHERKAAEERQQLLMAELDHRVRNILASIRSMVVMTSRSAGSKQEQAESLQGRVDAMARAHGLLTRQRWKGASLGQLLRDELEAYASRGDAVVLEGEGDWILRPQQALNFALVIHELATNAAKYGALSVPTGRVSVTWNVELDQDPARLRIVWQESGGPLVRQPERQGFGSRLILNALRQDEGGEVKLDYDPGGVRCEFSLPVRRGVPAVAPREPAVVPQQRGQDANALKGVRILLVEDEMLVGLEMRHALAETGADVIGPVSTASEAARLADEANVSAAVLDVNLGGDMIDPVAARLLARGIPFVFVTGYDSRRVLPEALRNAPALRKPVDAAALVEALCGMLAAQPEPQRAS